MSFSLAHITDLHMGPMIPFAPRYWSAKRLLGMLNWYKGRNQAHRPEVLAKIVDDMLAQSPDHIAVTGDLVNIGLPREHETALAWLRKLSPSERVSVIPGNHDIYTNLGRDEGVARWRDYMTGEAWDGETAGNEAAASDAANREVGSRNSGSDRSGTASSSAKEPDIEMFPYMRRLGPVALIGLNSAVPTKPFVAAGELGAAQRHRLARLLEFAGAQGMIRVVLIHHPPLPGQASAMRGLRDAAQLGEILAEHGAELVLHGHNHRNMFRWHPLSGGPVSGGAVPVVGAPSASMARNHHGEPLARYNIYRFEAGGNTGRAAFEMIGRGLAEPGGDIVELERRTIDPGEFYLSEPAISEPVLPPVNNP